MFFVSQTGMTLLPHRVALHPASRVSTVYLLKTGLYLRITIFKICFLQSVIFTAIYIFFIVLRNTTNINAADLSFLSSLSIVCDFVCITLPSGGQGTQNRGKEPNVPIELP